MDIAKTYKICPRCGNRFKQKSTHLQCQSCGLSLYLNPKPTTTVVMVNKSGEYLLVERAVEPAKGYWDFPGGFVEENETFEENARREMKEELGTELGELTYIGSITAPYLFQGVIYPTIAVIFITELLEGTTLKPDDDVASYAMFAPGKLPMDKLAFPEIKSTFKLVAEYLKSHKI